MAVKRFSYITVLIVLCQMFREADTQHCSGKEESISGMMLRGHIYKKITGAPLGDVCLRECYRDDRCQSFNYVIWQDVCELNNRTKEARPEDFVPNSDRYYFKRDCGRVPLGSTPKLPAETCKEIKGSEGRQAVSGKYWFDSIIPGKTVLAHCDMKKEDTPCPPGTKTDKPDRCCVFPFKYGGVSYDSCTMVVHNRLWCAFNSEYIGGQWGNCGFNVTFTNLGASGRSGPTSLGSHYRGQDHDGQVTLSSGIQQWTVPYTGDYRIEAIGAAGGYGTNSNNGQYRGRGAIIIGTFSLSKGEIIQIIVGQEGGITSNHPGCGGGGGTFVVRGSNTSLIIAGGGGGIRSAQSRHAGCDASTSTTGNPGYRSWSGGSNGHGAQSADNDWSAGGGGGFYSSGRSGTNFGGTMGKGGEGGKGFLQGGVGGRAFF